MPKTFENFLWKHKKYQSRSDAPPIQRPRGSKGSLSGFELPKIPPISAKLSHWNCLSVAGEFNVTVVSPRELVIESPKGFLLESPTLKTPPGLHGTNRFFVSIAKSNSLVEEARTSAWPSDGLSGLKDRGRDRRSKIRKDSVAVPTYSKDPHDEFRRSMEEMVRSRLERNLTVDWDYLVELVMCYVELNEKEARKYILKAFVDLIVPLRQFQGDIPARSLNSDIPARSLRGDIPAKFLKNVPRSVRTVRREPAIA